VPAIIRQVLADNEAKFPPSINQALLSLHHELVQDEPVRQLETRGPDGPGWTEAWRPHQGKTWLNIPWYFAESFFYRRLLEATGYFGGHGDTWTGTDPFKPRKLAELQEHTPWQVLSLALDHAPDGSATSFRALLHHCVWANRVDLSYNQVAADAGRQIVVDREQANLLVDDTGAVLEHLARQGGGTAERGRIFPSPAMAYSLSSPACIDFICDNAGTELLLDLALSDFLLRFNRAQQVTLHVKAHPTFVSDAVPKDVALAIDAVSAYPKIDLSPLGRRLEQYLEQGRLEVKPHLFWNSSLFFWQMPDPLRTRLAQARLVIIKGDANYRRLVGDSRWPTTVPVARAIPYFPAPFVTLRTMKSDPVVGLRPGQADGLNAVDPEWRVNGKRGLIQLMPNPA
jgi:uncharacterized protein with ATP-grasp and redox domains